MLNFLLNTYHKFENYEKYLYALSFYMTKSAINLSIFFRLPFLLESFFEVAVEAKRHKCSENISKIGER